MAFEQERETYTTHLAELLVDEGRFVVIVGDEINGPFDTRDAALKVAYGRYGLGPFMVKQISEVEPVLYFSRDLKIPQGES